MVTRISRLVLRLLALLLAIAAVTAGFLAWQLATGPVSVAWLNPYLERQLSGPRVVVELEDTQLRLGRDQLLELTATGVRVRDRHGRLLSELPEVEIGLSTSAMLLEGRIAVRRIESAAPSLVLTRREDGSIGFEDESAAGSTDFDIGLVLADFLKPADSAQRWGHIEEIRIFGGELVLNDRKAGRTLRAREAELRLGRLANRVSARLAFTIAQATEPAAVEVRAIHAQGEDRIGVEVDFDDLLPAEFADFAPGLPLSGIRLPLSGKASGLVGLEGELSPTRFDLTAQPGTIELPEAGLGVLRVDALETQGTLAADLQGLTVDRLTFSAEGALLSGVGEVAWRNGEPTLHADLEAENVTARDLERYWPPRGGRQARKWVTENITRGMVPKARARLRFGPGELGQKPLPEHTLDGEFVFEDLSVRYLDTMPPLVGVSGRATFTGQRMSFDMTAGHVDDLIVEQGSVVITGIGIKGRDTTPLEIIARVTGPVAQALALIDHPPLEFASKIGIMPEAAGGRVTTDLRIGMPLHGDLEPSEVRVAAQATITDGALAGTPHNVSNGDLSLTVDNHGLDLAGEAIVAEVPLRLDLRENFGNATFKRRYRIEGTPDVAVLQRLGLELPVAADGSLGIDATITEAQGGREVELALDLAPAAIDAPRIGWQKAAGEPATLDASMVIPAEGPIQVPKFLLV
ncbi:MAG: DUF3971 domain-containing protein, partial [Geminicoccaceae bacterium]